MSKGGQWITPVQYMKGREYQYQKLEKGPMDKIPWSPRVPPYTYFNNNSSNYHEPKTAYDMIFLPGQGYNQRIHRCDTEDLNIIHENVFREEEFKPVPVLTSLVYGRPCRPPLEPSVRFGKSSACKSFASRNGVNMEPDLEVTPY